MTQFNILVQQILDYGFADAKYRPSVKLWLNEAQVKIAQKANIRTFFEAVTFPMSSASTTLPTDFLRLADDGPVFDATNSSQWVELEPISLWDFDNAAVSTGSPSSYVIAGNLFYVYPTPDSARTISLLYYRRPTELVEGTDSPELSDDYGDVMRDWALKRAFEREADFEAAAYWENQFRQDLADLQAQAQYDTLDGPSQVQGMWNQGRYVGPVIP